MLLQLAVYYGKFSKDNIFHFIFSIVEPIFKMKLKKTLMSGNLIEIERVKLFSLYKLHLFFSLSNFVFIAKSIWIHTNSCCLQTHTIVRCRTENTKQHYKYNSA